MSLNMAAVCQALALVLLSMALGAAQLRTGDGWELFCVGNCSAPAPSRPAGLLGGAVLMGGGTDVEAALVWLVRNGRGGDIVILRAGPPGDDAYDPFIYALARCRSVSTLIVHNASAARASAVLDTLTGADAIFLAGGDQSIYYQLWHREGGGAIQRVLNRAMAAGVPVGGTSAGMAALAGVAFTGARGEVFSGPALRDPLSHNVTLVTHFLRVHPWLDGIITDMHFVTRDRMGRLIAFMANAMRTLGMGAPRALACNEESALLLDTATGLATLANRPGSNITGCAYALTVAAGPPTVLAPHTPLTWPGGVRVQKIMPGDVFDVGRFALVSGAGGAPYTITVQAGVLHSSIGSIYATLSEMKH